MCKNVLKQAHTHTPQLALHVPPQRTTVVISETRTITQHTLRCLGTRDVKQSSNIRTLKNVLEFVLSPFEIQLPNTGWSKFYKVSTMLALNSGHRCSMKRSNCQTYLIDTVR